MGPVTSRLRVLTPNLGILQTVSEGQAEFRIISLRISYLPISILDAIAYQHPGQQIPFYSSEPRRQRILLGTLFPRWCRRLEYQGALFAPTSSAES